MHDVKYSGDKGALALSIRDTWRLHNLASISVSDPGTSYSSAGGAAGGIASKEANKLVVMNFDEQRTTLKSISVTGPRGSSGTQFLLTSGDEHLKIIWFLRFLNSKYLLRDIELTGVENAELEQWYRTNVQLVHETFESSGFGFERRKLPKVDSLADPNKASVEANKSLMISEEEAMLQEMFETYNVEFRDTDMVDFLKEKLSHLEAENVEDIFGSERRVQDCVDKMEVASSTLDDLRCYMDSIHVKLQHMRKDIRAIDMQNYVFNIQRRNNKSMLDELEKIFDKGEVRQEVITALEKGTLEPPNWNDTLDAIAALTETIEYVNSKITELEKTRGIKDLSSQLSALRARFINRAVPALCSTFRAFIDEYGKGLRDRSHHKVHRRLLIYSPLVTKLRRLDRGFSERAGGAFCTKMHSQLIAEGRACMSEIAQSDTKHLSSCVHFVLWLWRFVPHMTKELEFALCFFLTDEKPGSGKPLKIASNDEEVADALVMSLFKSFEDTIRRISISALRNVRSDASLSSMIMMQAHVSAWRSFFRRKEYCRVLEFMFGALAAELEEKVEARARESGAANRSSGGGGTVKGMHLLPVVESTALVLADIARSADIDAVEKIFRDQGGAATGGGTGAEDITAVMNEARTLCKATSNRVVDSLGPPLLASLQRLASSDKKHGDRLLIENLDFIDSAIRRSRPKKEKNQPGTSSSPDLTKTFASLDKLMDNVLELYKSCMSRYVSDQMRYHIEPVLSFLDLLERTMPVMDRHEIGYQRGCTRTDLRKALSTSFNPSVERVLTNIKHRIAKHFSSSSASGDGSAAGFEGGVDVKGSVAYKVWSETQKSLLHVMIRLDKIVGVVFAEEKLNPSVHEIKELLKAI